LSGRHLSAEKGIEPTREGEVDDDPGPREPPVIHDPIEKYPEEEAEPNSEGRGEDPAEVTG
jgi:hypothetical protein